MLIIIFSLGQVMPVNHQGFFFLSIFSFLCKSKYKCDFFFIEQLNTDFITFLLEIIEENHSDSLTDDIIAFVLAFNIQFNDVTQNIVLDAIRNLNSAKIFTQKILLFLNREGKLYRYFFFFEIIKKLTNFIKFF